MTTFEDSGPYPGRMILCPGRNIVSIKKLVSPLRLAWSLRSCVDLAPCSRWRVRSYEAVLQCFREYTDTAALKSATYRGLVMCNQLQAAVQRSVELCRGWLREILLRAVE